MPTVRQQGTLETPRQEAMTVEITEIHEMPAFLALEKEWDALLEASHCNVPFLRHAWVRAWWSRFGGERRAAIMIGRRGGRLVFALPLVEQRTRLAAIPFISLHSMSNEHSYRFHYLLEKGEEGALDAFVTYLRGRRRRWHFVELAELPAGAALEALFAAARGQGCATGTWKAYDCPNIPVSGSFEDFFKGLKRKLRSNFRNRAKRLGKEGELSLEVITDKSELASALESCFAIEADGWKGDEGSAISCDEGLVRYYTDWAHTAAENGWLRLFFLKAGDKRVASDLSLSYAGKIFCMKIGHLHDYRPFSPGQLLCSRVLERCFDGEEPGIDEYDFLGPSTTQKRDWTSHARPIVWAYLYNRSPLAALHRFLKFGLRRDGEKAAE